mgnify:FL=1
MKDANNRWKGEFKNVPFGLDFDYDDDEDYMGYFEDKKKRLHIAS